MPDDTGSQLARLGVFRDFRFLEPLALAEYRKWLQRKCSTPEQAERIIDAAIELPDLPSIADLNELYRRLFTPPPVEISEHEQAAKREYLQRWYALELQEAERRRQRLSEAPAKRTDQPAPGQVPAAILKPITAEDIEKALGDRRRKESQPSEEPK
jgi:hypothetical protein